MKHLTTCVPLCAALLTPSGALCAQQWWSQVNDDGFGGPGAFGAALVAHEDSLFAVTGDEAGADVHRYDGAAWTLVTPPGLHPNNQWGIGAVHDDKLYLGFANAVAGCEVWELDGSQWTQVASGGIDAAPNEEVTGLGSYQGRLYIGTYNSSGARVYSYDGVPGSWTSIAAPGFGNAANVEANGLEEFGGKLYAATSNDGGCEVWEYDGASQSWTAVMTGGFGSGFLQPDARGMTTGPDSLYVGTERWVSGCEVHAYDGGSWTPVGTGGLVADSTNDEASGMAMFNGSLHVGVERTLVSGAGVYRLSGGTWTQANVHGFGDSQNFIAGSFAVFQGALYGSTSNDLTGTEVWRYEIQPYGCSSDPDSLLLFDGQPQLGSSFTVGVDDPSGVAASPSVAFVLAATDPFSTTCGLDLGAIGELLVSVAPPNPVAVLLGATPWTAPGDPVSVSAPVPSFPGLDGLPVHLQGMLSDGATHRLTEGLRFVLGS